MSMLSSFTDRFAAAVGMWPVASFLLTLPILAFLYHRDGRIRFWSACGAYAAVLYGLGLICFTLYPMPSGSTGLGITYGVPPQLNPFAFFNDICKDGMSAVFQIVANVAFFVPLGFIASHAFRLRFSTAVVFGLVVSLVVEMAQLTGCFWIYRYAYRTFDVNDLMWNTAGTAIGWACAALVARVLPLGTREELTPTDKPGFVRRFVALFLDMALVVLMALIAGSLALLLGKMLGLHGVLDGSWLFWFSVATCLVIEGIVPWMRNGCTPGGAFVRMTFETRLRTGARRAVFYLARLTTLGMAFYLLPLAVPLLLLFYVVKRCMPYDLI